MRAFTLALMGLAMAGCASRQPLKVRTLPPASFWICPSANICRASDDPVDIPPGYVCISQANKVTVCSPGGQVTLPKVMPVDLPMTRKQVIEHLALGAGAYAGLYAVAGSGGRPGAVAGAGVVLGAALKEGSDAYSGRDSRKSAIIHSITILIGAAAVAAVKH